MNHIPRGVGVIIAGVAAGHGDFPERAQGLLRRLGLVIGFVIHSAGAAFIMRFHIGDRPRTAVALTQDGFVKLSVLLVGAEIRQVIIRPAVIGLVVVMHGHQMMIRIGGANVSQPVLLVGEVFLVVRFLGKIPDDVWIRSVTGNQPAEE